MCVCVRAYVMLTGNISFRPQRINSFLMCSLKSSSSGDVTSALMSCMHATCNMKGTEREREREQTRERDDGFFPDVDEKHAGMHSKLVMSLGSRGP